MDLISTESKEHWHLLQKDEKRAFLYEIQSEINTFQYETDYIFFLDF